MREIVTKVYQFDELSDPAKEKAREWWRAAYDPCWWDSVYEDAKTCFAFVGLEISNIYFSGFWSQGDGACFEATWRAENVQLWKLQEHAPEDETLHQLASKFESYAKQFPEGRFQVKQKGHYSHEYCTEFDFELNPGEHHFEDCVLNEAEKEITETTRNAMRWIYQTLQAEHEYQNADEQVDESIKANEYTFTEDGKRFG